MNEWANQVSCLKGVDGDATPFMPVTVQQIAEELHKMGYQRYGNEQMYSGHTGKPLEAKVFLGPTYYQRLKHLVDDKSTFPAIYLSICSSIHACIIIMHASVHRLLLLLPWPFLYALSLRSPFCAFFRSVR